MIQNWYRISSASTIAQKDENNKAIKRKMELHQYIAVRVNTVVMMINTFRKSILVSSNETYIIEEEKDSEIRKVINSEDALLYLSLRLRDTKKYN